MQTYSRSSAMAYYAYAIYIQHWLSLIQVLIVDISTSLKLKDMMDISSNSISNNNLTE